MILLCQSVFWSTHPRCATRYSTGPKQLNARSHTTRAGGASACARDLSTRTYSRLDHECESRTRECYYSIALYACACMRAHTNTWLPFVERPRIYSVRSRGFFECLRINVKLLVICTVLLTLAQYINYCYTLVSYFPLVSKATGVVYRW